MTKDRKAEYNKEYYEENKEKKRLYDIEYRKTYKRRSRKKGAVQSKLVRECVSCTKEWKKEYYLKNKKRIHKRVHKWIKRRMTTDSVFKLQMIIRDKIRKKFKKGGIRTVEVLGCSYSEFKVYIESMFEEWMNWNNHGKFNGNKNYGWDLDHIIPISSAKNKDELIKLSHYANFQPLCSYKNRIIKRNNINVS